MRISLFIVFVCAIAILLAAAGCTQTSSQTPLTPTPTPVPTIVPTAVPTTVSTTPVPVQTMMAPASPLPVTIRDTPLLFTLLAPDGYAGTTIRANSPEYNIVYKTTIYNPATGKVDQIIDDNSGNYTVLANSLTVFSYSTSLAVGQNLRNFFRESGTVTSESVVMYNGITYTRFDARSDPYSGMPYETVIFVGNKASANEKGYLPVMIYTLTPGSTLGQATYENMVQSFQYYTGRTIGTATGSETDRPSFYQ